MGIINLESTHTMSLYLL